MTWVDFASDRNKQFQKAFAVAATISGLVNVGNQVHSWANRKFTYSISLDEKDFLYKEAHAWLLGRAKKGVRHVKSQTEGGPSYFDDPQAAKHKIVTLSNDKRSHRVVLDGYKIDVVVDFPNYNNLAEVNALQGRKGASLVFSCRSRAGLVAVQELFASLLKQAEKRQGNPQLRILNKYSEWNSAQEIMPRPINTVILRDAQAERIYADLEKFLDSEEKYVCRAIPYRRGYLLSGPPGSGKSSLVKALASEFGLDIWYLPLGDFEKDASLLEAVSNMSPRSIILIEDIDVYAAATSRDDQNNGPSISALLNAIDGIGAPWGAVLFLTSNHADNLDEALIRPGRVDVRETLDYLDQEQAQRLFYLLFDRYPSGQLAIGDKMSCSSFIEVCKRNMDDAQSAERELSIHIVSAS